MSRILSHYTSERGLIGIVRSQSLFATSFLDLNDTSEFFFALSVVVREAVEKALQFVPEEIRGPIRADFDAEKAMGDYVKKIRDNVLESDGYDALYVTSFAAGRNDDENRRGILTLWDRYTAYKGYCLQFDEATIRNKLEREVQTHSYSMIDLVEVKYGVDKSSLEFQELARQFSTILRLQLCHHLNDYRAAPGEAEHVVEGEFIKRLFHFCATHKDPAFADEREVRVLAFPHGKAFSRPLHGLQTSKTIQRRHNSNKGARYIIIGDSMLPGFIPKRIVAGPKTSTGAWMGMDLYPPMPAFDKSDLPVR